MTENEAGMGEKRNAHEMFVGIPLANRPYVNSGKKKVTLK
jgi:hypothetical protein